MARRQFQDAAFRIDRAHEHFVNFAKLWNDFIEDDPYATYVSVDLDGEGRIFVEPNRSLDERFSLELGEGLYQLRAALDCAIRACAVLDTGQDPPPREQELEFPITISPERFKQSAWKIAPLGEYRIWMIETVQPYNVVEGLRPEIMVLSPHRALALLHNWSRIDRHRRLHVIGSWAGNRDPLFDLPDGTSLSRLTVHADSLLENEAEIATFHVAGWEPEMHLTANANMSIDVALREDPPPAADNDTLNERIKMMRIFVAELVTALDKSFDTHPPAHRT